MLGAPLAEPHRGLRLVARAGDGEDHTLAEDRVLHVVAGLEVRELRL